jgi:flagellar biosynthesis regulator FlaF
MIWNRPPEPKNPKEIIETTLNLNEAQKKSFESLIPAHRKAMQKQHEQIFKLKKDLMMTLVDSDLSAQKEQLTEELGSALVQMDILRLNHLQDVYDLCSEEQRASFGKLITELESFIPPPPNPKIKKH